MREIATEYVNLLLEIVKIYVSRETSANFAEKSVIKKNVSRETLNGLAEEMFHVKRKTKERRGCFT